MTSRWWRAYEEMLDDPKVQRLEPSLFKFWINTLCLASRFGGTLPPAADVAFALRLDEAAARASLDHLIAAGLVEQTEAGALRPHNWERRQYRSDTSTERVRKHRSKGRNVSRNVSGSEVGNVTGTPPDTESESERSLGERSDGVVARRSRLNGRAAATPKSPDIWVHQSDPRWPLLVSKSKRRPPLDSRGGWTFAADLVGAL